MRDGEWVLSYPGTELVFGPPDLPIYLREAPDLGDVEIHADDVDRPRADGRAMGTDYRGARTITFELGIVGADEAAARATLATLTRAWRADAVRLVPGAVAELRTRNAGRERVAYGRPRKLATTETDIRQGIALAGGDFATVDDLWYGTTDHGVTLGIAPGVGGGLTSPLASPLTTTATSDRSTTIAVGGSLPAWPVVEVTGPIPHPIVEVVGLWRIELATNLAADQAVTIDTRPWSRRVQRADGASLAGALTRASARLSDAAIPPGAHEVVLRGADETGTASLAMRWRETYESL